MAEVPSTTSQWVIESPTGTAGLKLKHDVPLPALGPHDVLVKIHAVSLNARDNQIINNNYTWGVTPGVVPLSDGAGSFSFAQASTLPCAALTAWNALFCGSGGSVKPGDVVLTQGSGGVSLFAIQFARAAGATVIATTGRLGGEREARLRRLGAATVLSYREADWGQRAKAATAGGRGVDLVVETSGAGDQSAAALKLGGRIAVVGGVAGSGASTFDMRITLGELRRVAVGSRDQFEDMIRAIETNGIQPVVDEMVWRFDQAREAFEHAQSGKMLGKVVIRIAEEA
ncbi:hypothetical protein SLS62_008267 [Diatrype stigma]|uniref:Enoyl reductase (ER) domain-containing protein n=1 Tax=Diatrype stigma TaxID=117547 RepID=A0AAN9YL54_9PEZI